MKEAGHNRVQDVQNVQKTTVLGTARMLRLALRSQLYWGSKTRKFFGNWLGIFSDCPRRAIYFVLF